VGSHGNGGLRGSGSASAGTTVLRGRKLCEDCASCGRQREALVGGGACGLAARKAHPAEALHLSMLAPRGADPTTTAGATPPSLHLSRETFPPSRRAPPPRAWHRASSMHAEPHRSKQVASTPSAAAEPHSPAATADEDAAERWLRLVIVTVSMLPWSVPLWMDDSTP
jgi:hypothetical protein